MLGALSGAAVPDPARFGVDAAFPAALLALLLPALRRADVARVALLGAVVALVRHAVAAGRPSGCLLALAGLVVAGRAPRERAKELADEPDRLGGGEPRGGHVPGRLSGLLAAPAACTSRTASAGTSTSVPPRCSSPWSPSPRSPRANGFAGWARPAGVALGAVAAWRKLPLVVVVLVAAAARRHCG